MPPVRWLWLATLTILFYWTLAISAERPDLPVATNGWRPIIGENRFEGNSPNGSPTAPKNSQHNNENINKSNRNKEHKHPSHSNFNKNPGHIRINHHGSSGHHGKHSVAKPVGKPTHKPTSYPQIISNKMSPPRHSINTPKRHKVNKPIRQMPSHSNREELIAPAPSSAIGSYAYFNQGPFNVRDTQIRDTNKHFGHHEFRTHYSLPSNDLHSHPSHYSFSKHPSQNELHTGHFTQFFSHNDEFTRNLVPPPLVKLPEKEGEKKILLSNPQPFLLNKPKDDVRHLYPDVLQIPNAFGFPPADNIDLEVTKEKFREYHTTIAPPPYKSTTETYPAYSTQYTHKPVKLTHGYEVTEDKNWQENSPFFRVFASQTTPFKPQTYPTILPDVPNNYQETTIFLPTPIKPEITYPTSPTQAEVSTIYSEISKLKRPSYQDPSYNIKDIVATHYPIYELQPQQAVNNQENEVTTKKYSNHQIHEEVDVTQPYIKPTQETLAPTKPTTRLPSRNRLNQRRRRPTRPTTTTTENYEEATESYVVTEKPRRRRPTKPRTTEPAFTEHIEPARPTRRKPIRPTTEEVSENYPPNFRKPESNFRYDDREMYTETYEAQYLRPKEEKKIEEPNHKYEYEISTEYPNKNHYTDEIVEATTQRRKRIRVSTTEIMPYTNIKTPENELDYTTVQPYTEEPITVKEIIQTNPPEPETTATTTTTTEATTTKSNRLRHPVKYDSHRPRFSVKDYRQRLNQYTSTTVEPVKITSHIPARLKYPSRFTVSKEEKEETTESMRLKFKPKDPRHRISTTENTIQESSTEKYKPTRRPFNRIRTTDSYVSSTTIAPKISIKPNIFSNLKRPQPISLRTRIYNKNKNLTTTTEPAVENSVEEEMSTEKTEVTIASMEEKVEVTTETLRRSSTEETEMSEDQSEQESNDDAEAFLRLQRITELTSSAKNNPSYFKPMSSTSRRVPNYFTISTDDPILPIEAFFPKLTHRSSDQY